MRSLPDEPVELLTGFLKDLPESLADELLEERGMDNCIDEAHFCDCPTVLELF